MSLFRKGTKGILGVLLASPFGRGVTEGDGEGEDAGLVLRLFEILTITKCIIFVKTICWNC